MQLPDDFWFLYVMVGLLGFAWMVSEVDRSGHRLETPVWERVLVVAVAFVVVRLVHRRFR